MTHLAAQTATVSPSSTPSSTYEVLCGHVSSLAKDASFLASLRQPGLSLNEVVRLALDAAPALELLPLPVLAEELSTVFRSLIGRTRPAHAFGL